MRDPKRVERDRNELGQPENARPRDALGRPLPRGARDELGDTPVPSSPEEALRLGIEFFNGERFFQAHEIWEHGWHAAPEPERDFWQGVIQVAIGYCHFQRGNPNGAVTLLGRGARRLERYRDGHRDLPIARLAREARDAAEAIRLSGDRASVSFPRLPVA